MQKEDVMMGKQIYFDLGNKKEHILFSFSFFFQEKEEKRKEKKKGTSRPKKDIKRTFISLYSKD